MPMNFVIGRHAAREVLATFTQANGALDPAEWAAAGSVPLAVAVSQRAEAGSGAVNTTTTFAARHVQQLETDDVWITCGLYTPSAAPSTSLASGPCARVDPTTGDRIVAAATGSVLSIVTVIGGTRTTRASVGSLSIPAGSTVDLMAYGDTVDAYLNGAFTPTVTWTGAAAVIPGGSGKRAHGFEVASTRGFSGSPTAISWAIDNFRARDF